MIRNDDFPLGRSGDPLDDIVIDRDEPGYRLACLGDRDLLPAFDLRQQPGQMRFRFMDIDLNYPPPPFS